MPRSHKLLSGARPESFNVRWHSLANPATHSADIMSSPDPLNETTVTELGPPLATSRRAVTRSQRSQRFASAANSPRKQIFELQVGDTRAPQRLWVTVETDDGSASTAASARRKLFQSPASTGGHGRATTTVTVPLRDSGDRLPAKDGLATPKAKGRPRKSNATPMPGASRGKVTVPAASKTPRATRLADAAEPSGSRPEARVQPTPTSARRGRPPKRRILELDGGSAENGPERPAAKQTRRTQPSLTFEEWVGAADPAPPGQPPGGLDASAPGEDDIDLVGVPKIPLPDASANDPAPTDHDQESDIWMATISSDEAPRAPAVSPLTLQVSDVPQPEAVHRNSRQGAYPGGHDGLVLSAASDASSLDEPAGAWESQANDTIARGEDFSVIFMDSIPSLQGVFKSSIPPTAEEPLGEETSLIINNSIESLRRSAGQASAALVSAPVQSAPPEPPVTEPRNADGELASNQAPAMRTSGTRLPSREPSRRHSRSPRKADSASSPRHEHQKSVAGHAGDSATDDVDQIVDQAPTTELGRGRRASHGHGDEAADALYQDSFSEIPQTILMAAAPTQARTEAPHDKSSGGKLRDDDEDADAGEVAAGTGYEGLPRGSNASSASQSEAGRLPTPDDTPPQAEIPDAPEEKLQTDSEVFRGPTPPGDSPAEPEASEPSPPGPAGPGQRASAEAGAPSAPSGEATPARQASWPLQEPQPTQQEVWQDKITRPILSAIVRAGKALQSVTSDPPSPEGREKQLGSPFKSSGSRDSWNGSRDSQGSRRMSRSPQRPSPAGGPAASGSPAGDDPFGPATQSTGQARFMEALGRGLTADQDQALAGRSPSSSMRVLPQDEDAMSWVAREGPISPRLRGDVTLLEAHDAASAPSYGARGGSTWLPQRDRTSPNGAPEDTLETQDDETDIWEVQAQRESPRSARQRPFGRRAATSNQGQGTRAKTWAGGRTGGPVGSGRRAVAQPEEAASVEQGEWRDESGLNEYSLVAERRRQQQQQEVTAKETASASGAKRFDLSAFFSSPASIPRMLASKLLPGRTATLSRQAPRRPEPRPPARTAVAAGGMPTSSMFPPVPPEMLHPNRGGLGRAAPSLPAAEARSSDTDRTVTMPSSSSPLAAEQLPAAAPGQGATPPRMQLSHADIHRWQQETSKAGDVGRPFLQPLPPKNASPTKSSLRSPLKPRTPDRVVEFTSSVLSPAEQARVRQERRLSLGLATEEAEEAEEVEQYQHQHQQQGVSQGAHAPPLGATTADGDCDRNSNSSSSSHRHGAGDDADAHADADDSDAHADADDADAHADGRLAVHPSALPARTAWTRRHWLLLDQLLQLRRNRPLAQRYPRTADRFLGKTVRSQGEVLRLERWHLDCVDAFAAEVAAPAAPGVLVKRLAALVLAEQQRRRKRGRAAQPPPRDVMFH